MLTGIEGRKDHTCVFLREFYINSFSVDESASNLPIVIVPNAPLFFNLCNIGNYVKKSYSILNIQLIHVHFTSFY